MSNSKKVEITVVSLPLHKLRFWTKGKILQCLATNNVKWSPLCFRALQVKTSLSFWNSQQSSPILLPQTNFRHGLAESTAAARYLMMANSWWNVLLGCTGFARVKNLTITSLILSGPARHVSLKKAVRRKQNVVAKKLEFFENVGHIAATKKQTWSFLFMMSWLILFLSFGFRRVLITLDVSLKINWKAGSPMWRKNTRTNLLWNDTGWILLFYCNYQKVHCTRTIAKIQYNRAWNYSGGFVEINLFCLALPMCSVPSKIFISRLVSKKCRQDQKKLRRPL